MRKKVFFTVLTVQILLALLFNSSLTFSETTYLEVDEAYWGSGNYMYPVSPGDRNVDLIIRVKNVYESNLNSIEATLHVKPPFTLKNGQTNTVTKDYISFLQPGEEKTLRYTLNINPQAGRGYYNLLLSFSLEYESTVSGETFHFKASQNVEVEVPVLGKPNLKVTLQPEKIVSGEINQMFLMVSNTGDSVISNLYVTADVSQVFKTLYTVHTDISRNYYSRLNPGESCSIPFTLAAKESDTEDIGVLNVLLSYIDQYGVNRTKSVDLGFLVEAAKKHKPLIVAETFTKQEIEIYPGESFNVNFILKNEGEKDAKNVFVQLSTKDMEVTGLNSQFFKELKTNSQVPVQFTISTGGNIKPGIYKEELNLNYEDEDGNKYEETFSFGLRIKSLINVRLINTKYPVSVFPGETIKFETEVLATGTSNAQFLEIEVKKGGLFIKDTSFYVGRVDLDSPLPVEIEFTLKNSLKPGNYSFQVKLIYFDDFNMQHVKTLNFPLTIQQPIVSETPKPTHETNLTLLDQIILFFEKLVGIKP